TDDEMTEIAKLDKGINAQKNLVNKEKKHLFWWRVCIIIKRTKCSKTMIKIIYQHIEKRIAGIHTKT
ncbi:MAG: hypothetical protein Q4Q33_13170, partial [Eubacteriales bacterium]|nr:hypothetical protein [Eubacteriales bacterium]